MRFRFLVALFRNAIAAFAITISTAASAQLPGSRDVTFAANAPVPGTITAIGPASQDPAAALAVQPDGKVLVMNTCIVSANGNREFCITRLTANGELDTGFIGGGSAQLAIGPSGGIAKAIAVQPDGKIILGGGCGNVTSVDFCVARLNPNGTFDASFKGPNATPGNGRFPVVMTPFADGFARLALQPDGKIVLAGYCAKDATNTLFNFCVARLNVDGTFDPSFGAQGRLILGNIAPTSDVLSGLAIQPDGRILLSGFCRTVTNDFCIARLTASGALDTTFNLFPIDATNPTNLGKRIYLISGGDDNADAMVLAPNGVITLGGNCSVGSEYKACLLRVLPDSSPDPDFDGQFAPGNGTLFPPVSNGNNAVKALALQNDGKLIVAGPCTNGAAFDFCVLRLNQSGAFDSTFDGPNTPPQGSGPPGNGGFPVIMTPNADTPYALAVQADGKIVVAGSCNDGANDRLCVARLLGGPFGAKHCTLDIDGDGVVTATIDTLIASRVARGMRGQSIINGISFPANARRNTWPAIRDYLGSQCGLSVY
jgi:uncharacterized delta-60 repeat protein